LRNDCTKREPQRSARRGPAVGRGLMLLMLIKGSRKCGERAAVSSQGPRALEACGQARRAGAPWGPVEGLWAGGEGATSPRATPVRAAQSTGLPWERAQSTGFQCPSTSCGGPAGSLRMRSLPAMRLAAEVGRLVMGGADVR
jgi:hypothetical protein